MELRILLAYPLCITYNKTYNSGDFACAIMPMWQMSRYTSYMPEFSGKIAIAPAPVMEDSYVKSVGGATEIWNLLGFDPCNKAVWSDEAVTNNPDNQYVQYFENNPFDVLKEIEDGIAGLKSHSSSSYPSINTEFTTVTLNDIFENGVDVAEALDQAQSDLQNELGQ